MAEVVSPKDVKALFHTAKENNYEFRILRSVMQVNNLQREKFVERILEKYKGDLAGKTVAVWGLAFKPNTDDIREAPSMYILDRLWQSGAKVRAYDPEAMGHVKEVFNDKVYFASDQYDALSGADLLVIVTEWNIFRSPDFDKMSSLLKSKTIFDGRNLYNTVHMHELGYYYYSIGRETAENK